MTLCYNIKKCPSQRKERRKADTLGTSITGMPGRAIVRLSKPKCKVVFKQQQKLYQQYPASPCRQSFCIKGRSDKSIQDMAKLYKGDNVGGGRSRSV